MMRATLLAASLFLLSSLIPSAAADVSVLGGTVVIHTTGDVGVSALGDPVLRVADDRGPFSDDCVDNCVFIYGEPGGLEYWLFVSTAAPSCGPFEACVYAAVKAPVAAPVVAGAWVGPLDENTQELVCAAVACVYATTQPLCVWVNAIPVVCET